MAELGLEIGLLCLIQLIQKYNILNTLLSEKDTEDPSQVDVQDQDGRSRIIRRKI